MHSVKELSAEYLDNAQQLEARIRLLESQAARTKSLEVRRKLLKRINMLYVMVCEARQTAFDLEHYYDPPEEVYLYERPKRPERKKFSRHGYGAPTPALVMHGKNADKPPVSGIRAELSRRNAAKGNCTRV